MSDRVTADGSPQDNTPAREWAVVATNGKVAMTYPTKREAEDAAKWLSATWGGERLTVKEVDAA